MEFENISSREQIELKRSELHKQLHLNERRLRRDTDLISRRWRRLANVGSLISSVALNVSSYVGLFSGALALVKRLFGKRR